MVKNIDKINLLLRNELNDSTVVTLLALVRKELEILNEPEQFNVLKFFCDWILHTTIGRSKSGSSLIVSINKTIIGFLEVEDNDGLIKEISTILILKFKEELLQFFRERSIPTSIINLRWRAFLKSLLSNLENTPVLLHKKDKDFLKKNPIKKGVWIEQITVITSNMFQKDKEIYCLDLLTSNTTRILVPLTPNL